MKRHLPRSRRRRTIHPQRYAADMIYATSAARPIALSSRLSATPATPPPVRRTGCRHPPRCDMIKQIRHMPPSPPSPPASPAPRRRDANIAEGREEHASRRPQATATREGRGAKASRRVRYAASAECRQTSEEKVRGLCHVGNRNGTRTCPAAHRNGTCPTQVHK